MKKIDVLMFERYLEDNIFKLHDELKNQTYRHGPYKTFHIYDPKHRIISKATVKDRVAHHLVFKELYRIFESIFIYHSYSSINNKGTHLAAKNLSYSLRKVSKNYTRNAYVLKCDIKKFFKSISHQKLLWMIKKRVNNPQFLWLVEEIIQSFSAPVDKKFERERES